MKNLFHVNLLLVTVSIVCCYLTSCKKEYSPLAANAASTDMSRATTTISNDRMQIDALINIACANNGTGEDVHITGTLHTIIKTTVNGNHFTTKYHFQPEGVKGIGSVTGTMYQLNGSTNNIISGSLVNGKYNRTDVNNYHIIGAGPNNNYLVHEISHFTINANGKTTVSIDNYSAECK